MCPMQYLPLKVREKAVWEPNQARLDDMTNYRKEYTPKDGAKQASCKPNATPYRSDLPFEGDTTQRVDFVEWPTERVRPKEREAYQKPEGAMELNTTTGVDYTRKPLERQAPVRPQDTRKVRAVSMIVGRKLVGRNVVHDVPVFNDVLNSQFSKSRVHESPKP